MNSQEITDKIAALESEAAVLKQQLEVVRRQEAVIDFGLLHTQEVIKIQTDSRSFSGHNITRLRVLMNLLARGKTIVGTLGDEVFTFYVCPHYGLKLEYVGPLMPGEKFGLLMNSLIEWKIKT